MLINPMKSVCVNKSLMRILPKKSILQLAVAAAVLTFTQIPVGASNWSFDSGSNLGIVRPFGADFSKLLASVPKDRVNSEHKVKAIKAIELVSQGRLEEGSSQMNAALQLDPTNSYLQFFNAFVYHLMAQNGDAQMLDLAEQGYGLSIKFDQSNWIAHYFLGLLHFEKRNYRAAKKELAEVLLFREDDEEVLFRMVAASYYSGDPVTAAVCIDRLRRLNHNDPQILRLSAIIYAALGRPNEAQDSLLLYQATNPDPDEFKRTKERVRHWAVVRGESKAQEGSTVLMKGTAPLSTPRFIKTQMPADANGVVAGGVVAPIGDIPPDGDGGRPGAGADVAQNISAVPVAAAPDVQNSASLPPTVVPPTPVSAASSVQNSASLPPAVVPPTNAMAATNDVPSGIKIPNDQRMVLVDVVIMKTEDTLGTRKGVNLLSALTLQFGTKDGTAGFSKTFTSTETGGSSNESSVLTRAINIPALTYSLNIANSNSNLNEVLARPTLAALHGVKSEFFSGSQLSAAVVSSGTSGGNPVAIEKEIGVKLAITPTFMDGGKIKLVVDAQRTYLKAPSPDVQFTYKIDMSKIMVNANVVMNFGETLVLGGLSEKEVSRVRDGVPGLQSIPGVQYLFSNQNTSDFQRSVLMLITPRMPQYTYRSDEIIASEGEMGDDSASMKELRARYGDWFKPYPNMASVFNHLNVSSIYREFRTGDVTLEKWDRQETALDRLKMALNFLVY